jgi:sulfur-carrier protein
MKTYHIDYLGILADRRGLMQEMLQTQATTPAAIYEQVASEHVLGLAQNDVRAAVNDAFVSWNHELLDHDRIAFLPPMSGG